MIISLITTTAIALAIAGLAVIAAGYIFAREEDRKQGIPERLFAIGEWIYKKTKGGRS